jgi:histone H3/H4
MMEKIPPGLLGGFVFFVFVVVGCSYIALAKLSAVSAFFVTAVPIVIMISYALLLGLARLFRLRDDQSGDNLYYMGFLFTLSSLAVSLYQFNAEGSAEQIVRNFGIAIASTIAGIALRIFFNQMRRDPIEVEATARLELADASRRVRRELEGTILDFAYFRRMSQQSINDALDEIVEVLGDTKEQLRAEIAEFGQTAKQPIEESSKISGDAIAALSDAIAALIDNVAKSLSQEAGKMAQSARQMSAAIDGVADRLGAIQTPDSLVEMKLQPMLQGLSRAINSLDRSFENQSTVMNANLEQFQRSSDAMRSLVTELKDMVGARSRELVSDQSAPYPDERERSE